MRSRVAIVGFAAIALASTSLTADVIPPIGLAPGAEYQLVFVTRDPTTASSSNIADYNAFVSTQAALSHTLPSTTWHAVASTTNGFRAEVNAPAVAEIPLYNTRGIEVAANAADFYNYTASLLSSVFYDQFGNLAEGLVWTGTSSSNPIATWIPPEEGL